MPSFLVLVLLLIPISFLNSNFVKFMVNKFSKVNQQLFSNHNCQASNLYINEVCSRAIKQKNSYSEMFFVLKSNSSKEYPAAA